jgi:hypothetical protein
MDERRAPRTQLHRALTGEVTVYRPLLVSDLSSGGARVETDVALRVNSIRVFRLNFGDQTVVVQGRITHARVRRLDDATVAYTSGVEFVGVQPSVRETIDRFLVHATPPLMDILG